MKRRVRVWQAAGLMMLASITALAAASPQTGLVGGRWTLEAPESPHGAITMTLVVVQKETAVEATLTIPHAGDLKMTGEFKAGTLTLTTGAEGDHAGVTLSATLKGDTLTGYISSERGDVTWKGTRAK